jgi:RNA polymerase sigma factor (TIGR02999 family)
MPATFPLVGPSLPSAALCWIIGLPGNERFGEVGMQIDSDITDILKEWTDGDQTALDRLIPLVYNELKTIARARLRRERSDHTLNTTALVHEAYVRLVDSNRIHWNDRSHFFSLVSRLMRRLLVDYAHKRNAVKRGGGRPLERFDDEILLTDADADKVLEVHESLARLEKEHPRPAKVIEHRYFGGLSSSDIAEFLGVSVSTVERDARFARTWLAHSLSQNSVCN